MLSYDQRWHGDSEVKRRLSGGGKSGGEGDDPGACHVARLAVDLEEVLDAVLGSSSDDGTPLQVTCVGTSLGAAVLWSHYELFRGGRASRGERVLLRKRWLPKKERTARELKQEQQQQQQQQQRELQLAEGETGQGGVYLWRVVEEEVEDDEREGGETM